MVRVGDFSLSLIEAQSSKPFKEHTHQGKTYAEVEPDAEYFLRVAISQHPQSISPTMKVVTKFYVDGIGLGYSVSLSPGVHAIKGMRECVNGVSRHTALQFQKLCGGPRGKNEDGDRGAKEGHWTGEVKVEIYRKIELGGLKPRSDFTSEWKSNKDARLNSMTLTSKKKAVNSREGITKLPSKKKSHYTNYTKGEKLQTITLYYCSTVGLISANVLSPPPTPAPDVSSLMATISEGLKVKKEKTWCEEDQEKEKDGDACSDSDILDVRVVPFSKRRRLIKTESMTSSNVTSSVVRTEVVDLTSDNE